jgi:hypothetical protein
MQHAFRVKTYFTILYICLLKTFFVLYLRKKKRKNNVGTSLQERKQQKIMVDRLKNKNKNNEIASSQTVPRENCKEERYINVRDTERR